MKSPAGWKAAALACAALLAIGAAPAKRGIRHSDLPPGSRALLPGLGPGDFDNFVAARNRITADRLKRGEEEHLVAFVLQSMTFTQRPPIEPALSAKEYMESGAKGMPAAAGARAGDFVAALKKPARDERLAYFADFVRQHAGGNPLPFITKAYAAAMQFLYRKEFGERKAVPPLYQSRGHSSDTQFEANYAVYAGLAVLKQLPGAPAIERVLIVGPGLDIAPRTGYREEAPPQSFQPYAVADALLGLGLSRPGRLRIHCVDINPRVVRYFERKPERLVLYTTTAVNPEFQQYFEDFGRQIGASGTKHTIQLNEVARNSITGGLLNILTERYDPSPLYELVIVTNVLTYFDETELVLALANIDAMLAPGGYLLHNEFRPELESIAVALALRPVQARTIRLAESRSGPLLDGFVLHQKQKPAGAAAPAGERPASGKP